MLDDIVSKMLRLTCAKADSDALFMQSLYHIFDAIIKAVFKLADAVISLSVESNSLVGSFFIEADGLTARPEQRRTDYAAEKLFIPDFAREKSFESIVKAFSYADARLCESAVKVK